MTFRESATPLTIGSFLLIAITGVLMFFHLDSGLNKLAHEWLGWAMIARGRPACHRAYQILPALFQAPGGAGVDRRLRRFAGCLVHFARRQSRQAPARAGGTSRTRCTARKCRGPGAQGHANATRTITGRGLRRQLWTQPARRQRQRPGPANESARHRFRRATIKVGAGGTALSRYSVTRVPSSTTWFGGNLKKSAAVRALRCNVAKIRWRQ